MTSHRRRSLAVALAVVVLAACSSGEPRRATEATSSTVPVPVPTIAATTTTTVVLPPIVPLDWSPCAGRFDCARLTVPVDYANPAGPTLEVAVTRRPADDPAARIGTLIMNPGGPGSSGVRRVQRGFVVSSEVATRFDIVGFDPRGIGSSTPITCGDTVPAFRAVDLGPDSPEEQQVLEAAAAAVAQECATTEGVRLGHLGAIDVARDLEVLRRALGEPQVSFVGLSYGTLIGLLWAEAFPSSVRALVLDGVVDPTEDGLSTSLDQVHAIDGAFRHMDKACTTDAGCPLLESGGMASSYDELAFRIEAGEVTGHGVGPTQLAYAFFYATYGSEHWPDLWRALADGLAGDLAGVADMAARFTVLVSYSTFALVTCLDAPHPLGADAWRADSTRAAKASHRFGALLSNELLPCAFWPQSTFRPHPVVAEGTPPILVMGSTGDVATPYVQAERVAAELSDGVLLTIDIEGHVALGASACATEAATRYLVDLTVPSPDTRC